MPISNFICPDGQRIKPAECLKEGACKNRCATRNYLKMASSERVWAGKPSTTQLIQGTMCAFLKLTKDYDITPDSRSFMINGTLAHRALENNDDQLSLVEQVFSDDKITGIADVIEEENGIFTMFDYKTSGSFKVAKALGLKVVDVETDEVYKSGKKKGEKKTAKELIQSPDFVDIRDWQLQLNYYRILAEKKLKIKISYLKVQVIVRDGGTYASNSRGIVRKLYLIDIPILDDKEVNLYFEGKRKDLLKALEQGYWNEICSKEENWDGIKCKRYCEVAMYCKFGKYMIVDEYEKKEGSVIKGLSDIVRMPRLGYLRLGIKKTNAAGKEYPSEVDYFIIDPATCVQEERESIIKEFKSLFGDSKDGQVRQVKIMLPVDNEEMFFPQFYKRYGSGTSLQCKGDGVEACCPTSDFSKGLKEIGSSEFGIKVECKGRSCPYYVAKKCKEVAVLNVLIPDLAGIGVWQIVTSSYNSIVNVNSAIKTIRAIAGRVNMIPLTLIRNQQETSYMGKKAIHYPISIDTNIRLAQIQRLANIEASKALLPPEELSEQDLLLSDGSVVDKETGEIKDTQDLDICKDLDACKAVGVPKYIEQIASKFRDKGE